MTWRDSWCHRDVTVNTTRAGAAAVTVVNHRLTECECECVWVTGARLPIAHWLLLNVTDSATSTMTQWRHRRHQWRHTHVGRTSRSVARCPFSVRSYTRRQLQREYAWRATRRTRMYTQAGRQAGDHTHSSTAIRSAAAAAARVTPTDTEIDISAASIGSRCVSAAHRLRVAVVESRSCRGLVVAVACLTGARSRDSSHVTHQSPRTGDYSEYVCKWNDRLIDWLIDTDYVILEPFFPANHLAWYWRSYTLHNKSEKRRNKLI